MSTTGAEDRTYWLSVVRRIATPLLSAGASGKLKASMSVEHHAEVTRENRSQFTYLEAVGRLLMGLAPWLEHGAEAGAEGELRRTLIEQAQKTIASICDPGSPDFVNFSQGGQPLVDAAFLGQAILRARKTLWDALDDGVRQNVIAAMKQTRQIMPGRNNWLLFSAMVETFLAFAGETDADLMRIDYALWQHEQWYKGDGWYGDGANFHSDYYNSFVIIPMLLDITAELADRNNGWKELRPKIVARAVRHAEVEERMISPEGTLPVIGRSLAYRFGAIQTLAQVAFEKRLPESVKPAQVRCAMSALIRRMIEAPGTFDANGWLTIGLAGHQPSIGERYISTGSTYLCSGGLLPLGLPASDPFWTDAPADWTAKRAYAGVDVLADHAMHDG